MLWRPELTILKLLQPRLLFAITFAVALAIASSAQAQEADAEAHEDLFRNKQFPPPSNANPATSCNSVNGPFRTMLMPT